MRRALYRAWLRRRDGPLLAHLEEIEKSQWLSAEEATALQLGKLRPILDHAACAVPYYRDLFRREGFDPAAVRRVEDLRRLPPLDRATLVERFERGQTLDDLEDDGHGRDPVG